MNKNSLTIEEAYQLSLYKPIGSLIDGKDIVLVQHLETNGIYVRKIISRYNKEIYTRLKNSQIRGIPQIYFLAEVGESLIIIEEYIQGITLEKYCKENGCMQVGEAQNAMIVLCNILSQLHNLKPPIIHRDIKPSNIIFSNQNNLILIDFNASKGITEDKNKDTVLMGTKGFAAPEQYGFMQSDQRTDIYSLGVTYNWLITKELPQDKLVDGKAGDIIGKCTKLDPRERYQNLDSLKDDLLGKTKGNKEKKLKTIGKKGKKIALACAIAFLLLFIYPIFTGFEIGGDGLANSGIELWTERIGAYIAVVLIAFYIGDVHGIRRKLIGSKKKRVLWHMLFGFICFVIAAFLTGIALGIVENL